MLGMAQRVIRGVEVTDETLSLETIKQVALDPGHFLGHSDTLACMESEFLYPELADRQAPGVWEQEGSKTAFERAQIRAQEILASHYPNYIDPTLDAKIRDRFPIQLPREAMVPA